MKTGYLVDIAAYVPRNEQEAADKRLLLSHARTFGDAVLTRECEAAHITSSGFLLNERLDKTLLIHHNIRNAWAWTGGHADGDPDLLGVALREAREETGAKHIRPLMPQIASVDVLIVYGHMRRGKYVSAHLHLNVAYLLLAEESDSLSVKPDENSGVQWFDADAILREPFSASDRALYGKLIARARDGYKEGAAFQP